VAGCAAGATIVGSALVVVGGLLSPVPLGWRQALALVGVVVVLLAARGVGGLRLPQTPRQIPSTVVARRRPGNAWRFAVPYGTGLRTFLPTASPHVLAAGLALTAPAPAILAGAAAFGVGRGISLLLRSLTRRRDVYGATFERLTAALAGPSPFLVAALLVAANVATW
jgi:hypothetical protein